eukprot:8254155-Lingulodinium_polyedra.AAC.1
MPNAIPSPRPGTAARVIEPELFDPGRRHDLFVRATPSLNSSTLCAFPKLTHRVASRRVVSRRVVSCRFVRCRVVPCCVARRRAVP